MQIKLQGPKNGKKSFVFNSFAVRRSKPHFVVAYQTTNMHNDVIWRIKATC